MTTNDSPHQPLPRSPELMNADDTAVLVVDLQARLLNAQPDARQIVFNAQRLLEAAAILGVRVAATEQSPEKLGATVAELAPHLPGKPHPKTAFRATICGDIFAAWLAQGVRRVLLCGIETHVCVQQTALDLLASGFRVLVAVDAVGSRFASDRDAALRRMECSGAALTTTEAAIFEWCEDAAREEFRAISGLAKRCLHDDAP